MTFDEAEIRFRELQARVQRGEAISRAEYEDQVSQLAVQDERGVLWEINPRTGKWMYFDGAEWVGGTPPGRDHSGVISPPRATASLPSTSMQPSNANPPTLSGPNAPVPGAPLTPSPSAGSSRPIPTAPIRSMGPSQPAARANVPPGGLAGSPAAESAPSARRPGSEQTGTRPGGPQMPPRVIRPGPMGGANREWVPLAIGAGVLLFCAVILFAGSRLLLGGATTAPTRTVVAVVPPGTSTPMPTVIKLPTLTQATPTSSVVIAKVIENTVNVRAGPSTKDKILTKLKKDNQISLVGRNEKGDWYQVSVTGTTEPAWVFADTLQLVSGNPQTLPIIGGAAPTATKAAAPPSSGAAPTPTVIGARP